MAGIRDEDLETMTDAELKERARRCLPLELYEDFRVQYLGELWLQYREKDLDNDQQIFTEAAE